MSRIKEVFTSRFEGGYIIQADFCLAAGHKLLTEDFIWKPIEDIEEGETLIGFDEHVSTHEGRKFRPSAVLKTKKLVKPCVKIIHSEGEFICSRDHMFLSSKGKAGNPTVWRTAEDMRPGYTLTKVSEVWDTDTTSNDAGWMAGFLDGEGYCSYKSTIGWGQNKSGDNKLVLDKSIKIAKDYGFTDLRLSDSKSSDVRRVQPAGLRTGWHMIGVFQPTRLKHKQQQNYVGQGVRSRRNRKLDILSVEDIGEHEVYAVQTSTGTYLADGVLSHNCQIEVVVQAYLSRDPTMMQDVIDGVDFHVKRVSWKLGEDYLSVLDKAKINPVTKYVDLRTRAKKISFQRSYGAGAPAIAEETGIPIDDVKDMIKAEEEMYPLVKEMQDAWIEEVKMSRKPSSKKTTLGRPAGRGELNSITGRKYVFFEKDSPDWLVKHTGKLTGFKPTEIKNYAIQGLAGELMRIAYGKVVEKLIKFELFKDALVINTVHDSLILDVRPELLYTVSKLVKRTMENTPKYFENIFGVPFDLPLKVEVECGPSWGELEVLDI